MTENDTIPSVENLVNDRAAWLYFCPWYMNYLTSEQNNPVDNLIEIYNSEYCITLDELPDLKTYPMAEESGTRPTATSTKPSLATTTTASTTKASVSTSTESGRLWGDANLDKKVSVADAVAILQSIANKDKFALDPEGAANADVFNSGDGVTANDALSIQKLDAGQIEKLPESYKK